MREIIFEKFGCENFCCYKEPMEIEIKNNTLTMITGPNGIGKTTIFDIPPFTFYGITSSGARGDDVINNKVQKKCKTWVNFSLIDNQEKTVFRAERYLKYPKFGNTVILKKDNKVYKRGHVEVKKEIEKLLMPQKLFTNTLLFGQKIKTFFTDLTDSEQKEIFRTILQLNDYNLYQQESTKRISEYKDRLNELENNYKLNLGLIENYNKNIDALKEKEKQFYIERNIKIEKLTKTLEDNEQDLNEIEKIQIIPDNELQSTMAEIESDLASFNHQLTNIDSDKEKELEEVKNKSKYKKQEFVIQAANEEEKQSKEFEEKKKILKNNLDEKTKILKENIDRLEESKAKISDDVMSIKYNIKHISESVLELESAISKSGTCPTCLQEIPDHHKESLQKKTEELEKLKSETNIKFQEKTNELNKIQKDININKEEIFELEKDFESHIQELETSFLNIKETINNKLKVAIEKVDQLVKDKLKQIEDTTNQKRKSLIENIQILVNKKVEVKKEIEKNDELNTKKRNIQNNIYLCKKQIEDLKSQDFDASQISYYDKLIKECDEKINNIITNKQKVENEITITNFWKDAFSNSGIPSMLIDESIPFMNERVSFYLDKISNGRYIVSFDTLKATKSGEFRDKISVNIYDNETSANSRIQLSGGQIRLVDIATILTLNDLQSTIQNVKFNVLLFDEIFDSLDDTNIEYVSKALRLLSKDKAIYLISHRQIDQIEADEVLTFLK